MIPVRILAVRYLANASPMLCQALGAPRGWPALGLLTTDCDDATYIALDAATKAAEVEVAYKLETERKKRTGNPTSVESPVLQCIKPK